MTAPEKPISISRGHLFECPVFDHPWAESLCTCLPAQRMSLAELVAATRVENEHYHRAHRLAQEHVHTAPQHAIVDDPADGSQLAVLDELLDQTGPVPRVYPRLRLLAARVGAAADWVSSTAWLAVLIVPITVVAEVLISAIAYGRDDTPGGYAAAAALLLAVAALGVRYGRRWHHRRTR